MGAVIDLDDDNPLITLATTLATARRTMPLQRPGQSKQTYRTPKGFIDAVENRFGPITFDLAAEPETAWAKHFFTKEDDAFRQDWLAPEMGDHLWLNPPFANIGEWAQQCSATMRLARRELSISFLVPASIGAEWFASYVYPYAHTYAILGRLSFDDVGVYPKDCILARYHSEAEGAYGFSVWDWRKQCSLGG